MMPSISAARMGCLLMPVATSTWPRKMGAGCLSTTSGGANVSEHRQGGLPGPDHPTPSTYPKDVALDISGNIWVVDNHRVSQYNAAGENLQVFPSWDNDPWRCDSDNGHFCEPRSIAFDDATGGCLLLIAGITGSRCLSMISGSPVY